MSDSFIGLKAERLYEKLEEISSVSDIILTVISGKFKKFVKHDDLIEAISGLEYVNYVEELD